MSDLPLISCIMPTTGTRKRFVVQAIKYFLAQDYPNKELIIVVDHDDHLGRVVPALENIVFTSLYSDRHLTVGMKRNIAVSLAQGDIFCQWDDDDYSASSRLSRQVAPILDGSADVTGLAMEYLLHLTTWTAWKCTSALHKDVFAHDTHSGTLMYRKALWNRESAYPNIQIGEDAQFLRLVLAHGARLARLENNGDFLYIRHGDNVWPLLPGKHLREEGWQSFKPEEVVAEDVLAFYRQFQAVCV